MSTTPDAMLRWRNPRQGRPAGRSCTGDALLKPETVRQERACAVRLNAALPGGDGGVPEGGAERGRRMSGPELIATLPDAAPALPWFAWQPVLPVETAISLATLAVGVTALIMAGYGLRMMRLASEARNRQLDAHDETLRTQSDMLRAQGETLGELMRSTRAATRSLEMVIEQTGTQP